MRGYRIGFVLEQVLGHVTHSLNIQRAASRDQELQPAWLPIYYEMSRREARIPVYNHNWTVRAGWRVRRSLGKLAAASALDGLFIHTQVLGVLAPDWVRRYPTVVSLDATPMQYDQLGSAYNHQQGPVWMERVKAGMNQNLFTLASHLVTWTAWAKSSLVADYGIPAEKITVIPPGVDVERFPFMSKQPRDQKGQAVKILFVGGDFKRKGGDLLLEAFRTLRPTYPDGALELHLLTYSEVPQEPGVFVYRDIRPGDPRLAQHFASADIFALPTEGDCLPMVLSEAGACGLPLVSTRVGGIPEIVIGGETGLLVEPGDGRGLTAALEQLLRDPEMRMRMGNQARKLVCERHDAAVNTLRLLELIKVQVDARRENLFGQRAGRARQV